MMNSAEIRECLVHELGILDKILANTATQSRFVQRREMRGLRRLLRERAALIEQLAAVDSKLNAHSGWKSSGLFTAEARSLAAKQREILTACEQVLQQALAERASIAAVLGGSRLARQAKNNYVNRWLTLAYSSRLNVKG
jgi:hypothetical protein